MKHVYILVFDGDKNEVEDLLDAGAEEIKQRINAENSKVEWGIRPVAENEKVIMATNKVNLEKEKEE